MIACKDFIMYVFLIIVLAGCSGMSSLQTALCLSCSIMSSMQTGRVLNKGDVGWAVGYGGVLESDGSNVFSDTHFWEINVRYGLFKPFDVGLEFANYYPTTLDVKYQFVANNSSLFACSIGAGFTVQSIRYDFQEVGFLFPLYTSFHPLREVALFCSPRLYYYRDSMRWSTYAGLATGLRLGGAFALVLEYDMYKITSHNSKTISQALAGFSYNIP